VKFSPAAARWYHRHVFRRRGAANGSVPRYGARRGSCEATRERERESERERIRETDTVCFSPLVPHVTEESMRSPVSEARNVDCVDDPSRRDAARAHARSSRRLPPHSRVLSALFHRFPPFRPSRPHSLSLLIRRWPRRTVNSRVSPTIH